METTRIKKYRFDPPSGGLLQSVVNEALNGFRLEHFDEAIGTSCEEFQQLLGHFGGLPEDEVSLNLPQTSAFRNALRETLRKLGIEEFQTRTGYTFEFGQRILRELDGIISTESIAKSQ
jgi:hypothetical protein